ncbi:MAG: DNA-directed RNA polymerase subunit alpha [Pegethrix bostrychoides GSE-TBD4-15B]|uniref:DNA-directed RNA polymerase subunit alpha n=1 Tax=Pegethrix bostrychoides GSE-TBD4-15B TaxID=2839662 RepID=A0A951PHL9_9CYAN|nr:DNA-directed RNA polymerase subunit alpha [Pegethrix bostrychoides GSE-TBD4-15B]
MAQFQVECVESDTGADRSSYSKFVLEPLERGQGITVGNALRRILLSNIEGAAVTAVRIAGVSHEFMTIPGVREDVLDVLLNMKEVVLKSYSAPHIGRLRVEGPATITAGLFDLPQEVQVIDPDQYIATLAAGSTLEMEFRVEKGVGYRAIERSRDEGSALDFLQIDAIFMPVRKVNYTIEDARLNGSIGKDRLIMEVWTNGSLTPQEALSQAADILVGLFNPLREIDFAPIEDDGDDDDDPANQIPIEELQLSVRAYNCLKRAQINSVSDLLDYTQEELLEIKNFGAKSAEEVIQALQDRLGITLPHDKSSRPT